MDDDKPSSVPPSNFLLEQKLRKSVIGSLRADPTLMPRISATNVRIRPLLPCRDCSSVHAIQPLHVD